MIGDGDAVGVACQVVEDILGSAEGRFEVNHPVLTEQGRRKAEGWRVRRRGRRLPGKRRIGVDERLCFQAFNKLAAKDAAEHEDGQEEMVAG